MSIPAKSCSVEGCKSLGKKCRGRRMFVRGYCVRHYEKFMTWGDPLYGRSHAVGENRAANPLYKVYIQIKHRCYNPNDLSYSNYGARGIGIHDEWRDTKTGFKKFIEYIEKELGPRPTPRHTIDRINNDAGYLPGNLRWADRHVQIINRRRSKRNKSGYTGVSYIETSNKWCARIGIHGRKIHLGNYHLKEDAIAARREAEKKYFAPLLGGTS